MQKLLSNSDIAPYVNKILLYEELKNIKPKELVEMLPLAILYQQSRNIGHWTLLHKTPEGIEFFDSYGYPVDSEFQYLEMKQPHYLAETLSKLANVVQINYNQYKFQKTSSKINTCGRWILLRNWLSDLTTDEFAYSIDKISKRLGISMDELAVKATS